MRRALILAGVLTVLGGLLTGCSKNPVNAPPSSNATNATANTAAAQAAVASILASAPQVIEDQQFESGETATLGLGGMRGRTTIGPLRFWRKLTHVERGYDFAFSDLDSAGQPRRAIVTVTKALTGSFNIATKVATSDSTLADSVVVVSKPLDDRWVRKLIFIRVPHPAKCDSTKYDGRCAGTSSVADADSCDDDEQDWRLVGTSGVEVTSSGAQTRITSLRDRPAGTVPPAPGAPLRAGHLADAHRGHAAQRRYGHPAAARPPGALHEQRRRHLHRFAPAAVG
jgi:hypothetical protein